MRRTALAVWLLVALDVVLAVATYSRVPARELYSVSGSGIEAGLSRALVELNFPAALMAVGVLAAGARALTPRLRLAAGVAAALCLVVAVPGVVRQDELDARAVNAVPALGVLLAIGVSLLLPDTPPPRRARGDRVRIAIAAAAVVACSAWIAAAAGFFLDGVPVLGSVFQTGRIVSFAGDEPHPAVHHGIHHGWQGLLLVTTALLLSRLPLGRLAAAYLALMLAYGVGNIVNDGWLEQVAERGWTTATFPSVLEPTANWGWLVVLALAAAVWGAWFRRDAAKVAPCGSS